MSKWPGTIGRYFLLCGALSALAIYLQFTGKDKGFRRAVLQPLLVNIALLPLFVTLFVSKARTVEQWLAGVSLALAWLLVSSAIGFVRTFT